MHPEPGSLVFGGQHTHPLPGSLVLGGQSQKLGKLFDRFIAEARPCAIYYFRLQISEHVALIRPKKAAPYDDIKVKYRFPFDQVIASEEIKERIEKASQFYTSINNGFWDFAGYLKHSGVLFGCEAKWDSAGCLRPIRSTVLQELLGAKP